MVEQVVYVDIIDIALNARKVYSIFLLFPFVFFAATTCAILTSFFRLLLLLLVSSLPLVLLYILSTLDYSLVVLIRLILFGRFVL